MPIVTGNKFRIMKALHVNWDKSKPVDAVKTGSTNLISKPIDIKYIFAILCSKPAATKAVIGKTMDKILSVGNQTGLFFFQIIVMVNDGNFQERN